MTSTEHALEILLSRCIGALADIALSDDMNEKTRRAKAKRIYEEVSRALEMLLADWEAK